MMYFEQIIKTFFKTTIRKKLIAGFAVVICIFMVLTVAYISNLQRNNELLKIIDEYIITNKLKLTELEKNIIYIERDITYIAATSTKENLENVYILYQKSLDTIDEVIREYKTVSIMGISSQVVHLEEIKKALMEYYYFGVKVVNTYIEKGPAFGNPLMKLLTPHMEKLNKSLEELVSEFEMQLTANIEILKGNLNQMIIILIICLVVSVLIGILFSVLISNSISNAIESIVSTMKDIVQQKDITRNINIKTKDELSILALDINVFLSSIKEVFSLLKSVSSKSKDIGMNLSNVASKTETSTVYIAETLQTSEKVMDDMNAQISRCVLLLEQMVKSINGINSLVVNQSSAIIQASSSITEIAASIKNVTGIVETRKQISEKLSVTASDGLEKMRETIESVDKIAASASNIHDMTEIINSIAGQTDILSINAAIEAACAGDAGKGFAVVAEEIRKLSDQTGEYAKQMNVTLESTVKDIRHANDLNKISGEAFDILVGGIKDIVIGMEDASTGMNELQSGSEEIVRALESLVKVTEQIKEGVGSINENVELISGNMLVVSVISDQTLSNVQQVTEKSRQISKALLDLSQIGNENKNTIKTLDDELNQYKTV